MRGLTPEKAPAGLAAPWRSVLKKAFDLEAVDLSAVPLDERDWTDFTRKVYRRVRQIPRGKVRTYGEVARAAGSPGAARAVGQAMARNPVAPVVPCHRVVGSDGGMRGFSAPGGVAQKARMLQEERG